jgi:hypothetical protein
MTVSAASLRYRKDLAIGALRYREDLVPTKQSLSESLRYREDLASGALRYRKDLATEVVLQDVVQQDVVFAP